MLFKNDNVRFLLRLAVENEREKISRAMRNLHANVSEFELIPADLDFPPQKEDHYDANNTPKRRYKFWSSPITKAILVLLPLIAALAPVILLVAFSPSLSHALGANGCTPSGEFVLPYTTSIWDAKRFFSITIAFLGPGPSDCSFNAAVPQALACTGYSFTQAKVIDIAWDILVGRGGQAAVIVVAYRVFGRVVKVLMRQGEVGYDLFSAVAFDAGSASTLVTIGRHVVGATPVPRTRRAVLAYVGMALATLYIVAVPSLLAAMTGYTSFYGPVLDFNANVLDSPAPLTDCEGEIAPLWGEMPDVGYIGGGWYTPTTKKAFQIAYGGYYTPEWVDCRFFRGRIVVTILIERRLQPLPRCLRCMPGPARYLRLQGGTSKDLFASIGPPTRDSRSHAWNRALCEHHHFCLPVHSLAVRRAGFQC